MNGRIIIYCKDVSAGVVQDTNGRKYIFNLTSWMSGPAFPLPNMEVTFLTARSWATDVRAALVPDIRKNALQCPKSPLAVMAGFKG